MVCINALEGNVFWLSTMYMFSGGIIPNIPNPRSMNKALVNVCLSSFVFDLRTCEMTKKNHLKVPPKISIND